MSRSVQRLAVASFAFAILTLPLCASRFPTGQGWKVVALDGYRVFSNAGDAKTREVTSDIVKLRQVLTRTSGLNTTLDQPINVFVFKNTAEFSPFREAIFGQMGARNAGAFVGHGDGKYIAIDASADRRAYGLIYHELIHLYLNQSLSNPPVWFNEGLAEYYSTLSILGNRATVGTPIRPHLRYLRRTLRPIPIEELLSLTLASPEYRDRGRQQGVYAQSWLLVHYLMSDRERRERADRYVANLHTMHADEAFRAAFGSDFREIEAELRVYARRLMFAQQVVPVVPAERESAPALEPVGQDEILATLGEFLIHAQPNGFDLARKLFESSLALNESNARSHVGLAMLAELNGDPRLAAEHYARAIACDPPGHQPFLVAGEAGLRGLFRKYPEGGAPAAEILEVRALFDKAIERSPRVARAWLGRGKSFLFEDGGSEEAIDALFNSWALRAEPETALSLAVFHSRRGEAAEAEFDLDAAMRSGGNPALVQRAREAIPIANLYVVKRLLMDGEDRAALAQMQRMVAEVADPAIRASLERDAIRIEDRICREEQTNLYNAAVASANRGDYLTALQLLDALPAPTLHEQVRGAAENLRGKLSQRLAAQRP